MDTHPPAVTSLPDRMIQENGVYLQRLLDDGILQI